MLAIMDWIYTAKFHELFKVVDIVLDFEKKIITFNDQRSLPCKPMHDIENLQSEKCLLSMTMWTIKFPAGIFKGNEDSA